MAGSNDSGQDMEAGRTNRASRLTRIWMSPSTDGDAFEGPGILIVEPQLNPRDDDDSFPISDILDVTGIMGTGSGTSAGVMGTGGGSRGVGVTGFGGGKTEARGTGVFGFGTFGLHGAGISTTSPTVAPGAGVVAQGGRRQPDDRERMLHGAGVIALAGGADQPIPGLDATGSVGVYARGGDSQTITTSTDKETLTTGQPHPGPGVVGWGGTTQNTSERQRNASGVVGFAGGTEGAPQNWMFTCGVYGAGLIGVAGWSSAGAGIRGASEKDRGGRFVSNTAAQINLAPSRLKTAKGLKDGEAGDLLVTMDGGVATLWFCKRSTVSQGGVLWVEVA